MMKKSILVGLSACCLLTACKKENSDTQSPQHTKLLTKISRENNGPRTSTEFSYDNNNKLKGENLQSSSPISLSYDANNVLSGINSGFNGYSLIYDLSGKITKVISQKSLAYDSLVYDKNGNISLQYCFTINNNMTSSLSRLFSFKWDDNKNLIEKKLASPPGFLESEYVFKWTYTYDNKKNPLYSTALGILGLYGWENDAYYGRDYSLTGTNNIVGQTLELNPNTRENDTLYTSKITYTYNADGYPRKCSLVHKNFSNSTSDTTALTFEYK